MPVIWPLRTIEVARRLGVTPVTLRNDIHSGKLKGLRIGRHWRFARPNLVEYIGEAEVQNIFDDQDGPA